MHARLRLGPSDGDQRYAEIAHSPQHSVQRRLVERTRKQRVAVVLERDSETREPVRPRRPEVAPDPDLVGRRSTRVRAGVDLVGHCVLASMAVATVSERPGEASIGRRRPGVIPPRRYSKGYSQRPSRPAVRAAGRWSEPVRVLPSGCGDTDPGNQALRPAAPIHGSSSAPASTSGSTRGSSAG